MAIHVIYDPDDPDRERVMVWSDCELGEELTGRCVGVGRSVSEAASDAFAELVDDLCAVGELLGLALSREAFAGIVASAVTLQQPRGKAALTRAIRIRTADA